MSNEAFPLFNIALTPAGVLYAFSQKVPDATQAKLQSILSAKALPRVDVWMYKETAHEALLDHVFSAGWIQRVHRDLTAPDVKLDEFLSHVIAGLSGERRVALASAGGFVLVTRDTRLKKLKRFVLRLQTSQNLLNGNVRAAGRGRVAWLLFMKMSP
ncbi:MAG: hypothetical protein IPI14_09215 [Polaromonas sp.]|nr:hypothetical protein [Polaromonas sp.]